jgi:hypothetical protein
MKNLQKLETEGLLKSDSYGVKIEGKEKLWRILASAIDGSPKKRQEAVLEAHGITQTSWKIHASLYEHEKACGDVFVTLVVTGKLWGWGGEGNQEAGFRHDRSFKLYADLPVWYLEMETGSQKEGTWRVKLDNYVRLSREVKEPFIVLFTMPDEKAMDSIIRLYGEYKLGDRYAVCVHEDLVQYGLKAGIATRFGNELLSNYASKYATKYAPTR